ncbi:MAG: Hpt domain-containing protein [Limisphaerales bacterium]
MTTTAAPYSRLPSAAFVGTVGFHEGNALFQVESGILRAVDPLVEDLGASTIVDLLNDFIAEAPVRLRELDALADRPETQEVFRRTAHSFKGTSGIFGLAELVRLSMELEMGTPVRSTRGGSQGDRVRELRSRFQEVLPALRSVRRQLQART